jgi:hypothetical protein
MKEVISIIADICGILGFVFSLFALKQIQMIKKDANRVNVKRTNIGGDFVGRDRN